MVAMEGAGEVEGGYGVGEGVEGAGVVEGRRTSATLLSVTVHVKCTIYHIVGKKR